MGNDVKIRGRIVDSENKGIEDLIIEAWDYNQNKDSIKNNQNDPSRNTTHKDGKFVLTFDKSTQFGAYLKVYREDKSTKARIEIHKTDKIWEAGGEDIDLDHPIKIEKSIYAQPNNFTVSSNSKKKYTISGQVIDKATNQGVEGLRIVAKDKNNVNGHKVGTEDITKKQGTFNLEVKIEDLKDNNDNEISTLVFKIFPTKGTEDEKKIEIATSKEEWNINQGDANDLQIKIDLSKNQQSKTYNVYGKVIDQKSRKGLGGLRVEVWDKDVSLS